jgi:DNA-binding MarR family transcriptional regulator
MAADDDQQATTALNIGLLCFIVNRAMEERVLSDLAAAGFDDITMAQARLFAQVGDQGTRLVDLADRARVTKQTAGFLVDQLERGRYVRRTPDPRDGRARLVVIADRGHAAVEIARGTEARVQAEWTRHLGVRATRQLHHALTKLREITDRYQTPDVLSPGL